MKKNFYSRKKVCITGGAGFIGSHLVDRLISNGAQTKILDNLSTGSMQNVLRVWEKHGLRYKKTKQGYVAEHGHTFVNTDLREFTQARKALKGQEIVFHLAAIHGGRGFIDMHPADCCDSFSINSNVFKACHLVGVDRVQFASSACVYPMDLQNKYGSAYLLKENDAFRNGWGNADQEYGWAKLMGELTLRAYHKQYGLKSSITRYVTVYGPWENDTHAIIALIRRAVEKKDPYVIWGSGKQDRDFTYVEDIVSGTLFACEHIVNAEVVNLGTSNRYTIAQTAEFIFELLGWRPEKILFDKAKPEGVKTRALDIKKAQKLLNWEPKYTLRDGLEKTIEWFVKEKPKHVESEPI